MTQHPRHNSTTPINERARQPTDTLQGEYGSGGSYGAGGAFKDDEPGSAVEEAGEDDSTEHAGRAPETVSDVHTRDAEENDPYLREARRENQEREARTAHEPRQPR